MKEDLSSVSLVIITLNEEDDIERCIRSAEGAGEVIVVDSFSTDRTVDIARSLGAAVYEREFISHADQKNWAIGKASLDWILVLDADELLSPPLRSEIAKAAAEGGADGFWMKRDNEFFGKKIRFCGWNRDRVLRFFRNGRGHYPERAVHEKLQLEGKAASFRSSIIHRPYKDIDDYIDRMTRYSRAGALELKRKGKGWFPGIILNPVARFLRMYFLQLGFLDGMDGLILCRFAAASVFFKYSYLREMKNAGNGRRGKER